MYLEQFKSNAPETMDFKMLVSKNRKSIGNQKLPQQKVAYLVTIMIT